MWNERGKFSGLKWGGMRGLDILGNKVGMGGMRGGQSGGGWRGGTLLGDKVVEGRMGHTTYSGIKWR